MNTCNFLFFEDIKGNKHPISNFRGVYSYKASPATHWSLTEKEMKEKINEIGPNYYATNPDSKKDIEISKQVADKLRECLESQTIKN